MNACQVCGKDAGGGIYWYRPADLGLLTVMESIGWELICDYCKKWSETVFVKDEEE